MATTTESSNPVMPQFTYPLKAAGVLGHENGAYPDALGPTIVDDYEDGGISEYSGATADFTAQTTTVYNGSYALEGAASTTSQNIGSTTGLNAYPAAGDTFRFYRQGDAAAYDSRVYFAVQDASSAAAIQDDSYQVLYDAYNGAFKFVVSQAGSGTVLASSAVSWSNYSGAWLETVVSWGSGGSFTIDLYDSTGSSIASLSASDTTFSAGGVGLGVSASSSKTEYLDYIHIP